MSKPLGRKQAISNDLWIDAIANIENAVLLEELRELEEKTVEDIRDKTKGRRAAYAWSGGKDSIVLQHLCERAGVDPCMFATCELEYPAFVRWIEQHRPAQLVPVDMGLDLDWLAAHPEALFPPMTYHWSRFLQIAGEHRFYQDAGLDILLLGRRRADGNFVGRGTNIYTDRAGRTKYNPLADWTHEQVLAFIHYHHLPLPPFYEWADGYRIGTHPWFARPYIDGDLHKGWQQIYGIDPTIVEGAASRLDSARDFLREVARS